MGKDNKPLVDKNPELAASLLTDLVADDAKLTDIAKRHGIPKDVVGRFLQKLKTGYLAFYEEAREVSASEMLPLIDTKRKMLVQMMTPDKMSEASVRDLAVAFGILSEKASLLRGEPTQIISSDEREKLNELWPAVLAEAKRRGMFVDVDYVDVTDGQQVARTIDTDPVTSYAPKTRNKKSPRARS